MNLWTDENQVPDELLALLDVPEVPSELWKAIIKARDELENEGAVTYPTKATVEYYIHKYHDLLSKISQQH